MSEATWELTDINLTIFKLPQAIVPTVNLSRSVKQLIGIKDQHQVVSE